MCVDKRYYANRDSAMRALRKWGIGAGSALPYLRDSTEDGKPYAVYFDKSGPMKALQPLGERPAVTGRVSGTTRNESQKPRAEEWTMEYGKFRVPLTEVELAFKGLHGYVSRTLKAAQAYLMGYRGPVTVFDVQRAKPSKAYKVRNRRR